MIIQATAVTMLSTIVVSPPHRFPFNPQMIVVSPPRRFPFDPQAIVVSPPCRFPFDPLGVADIVTSPRWLGDHYAGVWFGYNDGKQPEARGPRTRRLLPSHGHVVTATVRHTAWLEEMTYGRKWRNCGHLRRQLIFPSMQCRIHHGASGGPQWEGPSFWKTLRGPSYAFVIKTWLRAHWRPVATGGMEGHCPP